MFFPERGVSSGMRGVILSEAKDFMIFGVLPVSVTGEKVEKDETRKSILSGSGCRAAPVCPPAGGGLRGG